MAPGLVKLTEEISIEKKNFDFIIVNLPAKAFKIDGYPLVNVWPDPRDRFALQTKSVGDFFNQRVALARLRGNAYELKTVKTYKRRVLYQATKDESLVKHIVQQTLRADVVWQGHYRKKCAVCSEVHSAKHWARGLHPHPSEPDQIWKVLPPKIAVKEPPPEVVLLNGVPEVVQHPSQLPSSQNWRQECEEKELAPVRKRPLVDYSDSEEGQSPEVVDLVSSPDSVSAQCGDSESSSDSHHRIRLEEDLEPRRKKPTRKQELEEQYPMNEVMDEFCGFDDGVIPEYGTSPTVKD